MNEFFIVEKDRSPVVRANLQTDDGYIDLSGGTGYFLYKNKYATGVQPVTGNVDILGATSGYVQFGWTSGDVTSPGVFYARWRVSLSNGKQISIPNDSFLVYSINEDLYSL